METGVKWGPVPLHFRAGFVAKYRRSDAMMLGDIKERTPTVEKRFEGVGVEWRRPENLDRSTAISAFQIADGGQRR